MKFFQIVVVMVSFLFWLPAFAMESEEITPFKYINRPAPSYDIPASSRFTVKREEKEAPEIVYYLTTPKVNPFAIAILCEGSSMKGLLSSVIHFHRYFLQEFRELGLTVMTIEQWGIDGDQINDDEFWRHYTPTQRLKDHQTVINYLKNKPPAGWNKKFVFLGASEGGPLVTDLTMLYPDDTRATLNWVGAGDWSWREELWGFIQAASMGDVKCQEHQNKLGECQICFEGALSRKDYDARVDTIQSDPTTDKYFFGMTHLYLVDVFKRPPYDYRKIHTPFLVVAGVQDHDIQSSDEFIRKALADGAPVTYHRIEDMGHGIRQRPDVIEKSFEWLREKLQ
ncbi:MAG: hypothetical protein H0X26_08335 [Alphaproteobacteria bacterium]|nr:hypothetical protein [Alphaproteobacteria bacterium]